MGSPYRQFPFQKQPDNEAPADLIPDNGIVERFHKTVLDEFYRIAFRKKIYGSKAAAAFPRKSSPARTCGKASRPRRAGPRSRVARVSPHR
jgi:hypothetical protein